MQDPLAYEDARTRRIDERAETDLGLQPESIPGRIGPYTILGVLGHGGMGIVYLAEDAVLNRQIAIKLLPAGAAHEPEGLTRFIMEAQLLAGMNHPNVATVYSLEEFGEFHFITMELVRGENLASFLVRGTPPLAKAFSIGRQIAIALEAAHKKGLIHCDLKPQNIMVSSDGVAKVLDFGLARSVRWARRPVTRDLIEGTPGYMSPEQLMGKKFDQRADIWAFACIWFECLSGHKAFPGESTSEKVEATLRREPNWNALPLFVPERLRALLKRSLAKDAHMRPQSISIIRREIEDHIVEQSLPVSADLLAEDHTAHLNNLPLQLPSFVGRQQEVADVERLLSENRLVTLTGAGGCGKTRLAIEIAGSLLDSFPDGVWLAELAPLKIPELVPETVASVLGVREEPNRSLTQTIIDFLKRKRLLLVLDNCEHLLDACVELINALFRARSDLCILVTSREVIGMTGEVIYRVSPLEIPAETRFPELAELGRIESVRLFVERAAAVQSGFSLTRENAMAIAGICRELDGIPLAIELAAARVGTVAVEELARRLEDRFQVLTAGTRDGLPHHQTLGALIDWSYDYLDTQEQTLLCRLSVFSGGWTLRAAESVCGGGGIEDWEMLDLISRLVDKSLIEMEIDRSGPKGRASYRMLETVRQYAGERLRERHEDADIRRRHRAYYLSVAEEAAPQINGPDQANWMSHLERANDNLRVALQEWTRDGSDGEAELRIAAALGRFWMIRGYWSEGSTHYAEVLKCPAAKSSTPVLANALNGAGNLAFHQGEYPEATRFHSAALRIRREIGDRQGEAKSLNNLGEVARLQADYETAKDLYEQCLRIQREIGDKWGMAVSLNNLGETYQSLADYAKAREYHEEGLTIWPELGDKWGLAFVLHNLGVVEERQGYHDRAREYYTRSLALRRELGDSHGIASTLSCLGSTAENQGKLDESRLFHLESLKIRRALGDRQGIAESLERFGSLEVSLGNPRRSAQLLGAAGALRKELAAPMSPAAKAEFSRVFNSICRSLGTQDCASEIELGARLSTEEAMESVFSSPEPTGPYSTADARENLEQGPSQSESNSGSTGSSVRGFQRRAVRK